MARWASARAASTNWGSFRSTSAWSGVAVVCRLTAQTSRRGGVEGQHGRRRRGPFPERIEAAAMAARAGVALVGQPRLLLPQTRRLIRLDRRSADRIDQQAARRQRAVADHLGRQPEPRPARQAACSRGRWPASSAGASELCRYVAEVTISRISRLTSQPESMNVPRQPVEQLGVRREAAPGCRNPRAWRRCPGRRTPATSG